MAREDTKSDDKLDHEVVNDFAIDAIKDNFTPPGAKSQKEEELPFTDEELEDIYTAMYESDDPDYTNFYLSKYPDARDKDGWINYEHSGPELGKEYLRKHPEIWERTRDWLDTNKEVEAREEEKFQKWLDDYMAKNKKGRDDIPVTTRR